MNRTAYLLVILNQDTGMIEGVRIFSEETPTTFGAQCTAQLAEYTDRDYARAYSRAAAAYAFHWPALARRFPIG